MPDPHEKQLDELVVDDDVISCAEEENTQEVVQPIAPADAIRSAHDMTHSMRMAKKCKSEWNTMIGSESLRQCTRCRLLVVKTQDLSEDGLSQLFRENEEFLARCETNTLSALQAARREGLYRRMDGAITIGDCYARRMPRPLTIQIWGILGFFPGVLLYLTAPGYIVPFLGHPIARIALLIFAGWHFLGCFLLSRTSNVFLQILIVVLFMAPLGLAWVFGPAVMTIMQAIGPVMALPK